MLLGFTHLRDSGGLMEVEEKKKKGEDLSYGMAHSTRMVSIIKSNMGLQLILPNLL